MVFSFWKQNLAVEIEALFLSYRQKLRTLPNFMAVGKLQRKNATGRKRESDSEALDGRKMELSVK